MLSETKLKAIIGEEDFNLYDRLLHDEGLKAARDRAMLMAAGTEAPQAVIFVIAMMKGYILAVNILLQIIHALQVELIEKEIELLSVQFKPVDLQALIIQSKERHNLIKEEPASASKGFLARIRNWRPSWVRS